MRPHQPNLAGTGVWGSMGGREDIGRTCLGARERGGGGPVGGWTESRRLDQYPCLVEKGKKPRTLVLCARDESGSLVICFHDP